jgi:hypothetical protein
MKIFDKYTRVVAIKEKSSGNESVGNMWVETKTFKKDTPICEIIEWAKDCYGKLTITIDESDTEDQSLSF